MRDITPITVLRSSYARPAHLIDRVELEFDLDAESTTVLTTLHGRRDPAVPAGPLHLDGRELELLEVRIDGRTAAADAFSRDDSGLAVHLARDTFTVQVRNRISPARNSSLLGLFESRGSLFTQCEAEGFRRITYFPDRPDVMARYRVTLRAQRTAFPVLLSNGNLVEEGPLADGRHMAVWDDPFPKPSYLFALVAGNFACREELFTTASGRIVRLQVWSEPVDADKTGFALRSLQAALRWDERRFGRELDLDRFMIVASHDFNMGAMENKGLNIFNARFVLADPAIATDTDYAHVESVIGHEYFHNWTGNRVTCRDWFQLSLKEGLTVFRDQEFTADQMQAATGSADARTIKRIEDVRALRAVQFPEDAGPMAHPVRPDSYEEINNFYTPTVYEKGAEVVRMQHTLLGEAGFRRGMDLYFERHDGQAVTCDDFVAAMADANGRDLSQFARWYEQVGTPRLAIAGHYDANARAFELTIAQGSAVALARPYPAPLLIPLALGLVGPDGRDQPLRLESEAAAVGTERVIEIKAPTQTLRFVDLDVPVVPSLARGFSAPVIIDYRYTDTELAFLAAHDRDGFNRWDASQRLTMSRLQAAADAAEAGQSLPLDDLLRGALRRTLIDNELSAGFREQVVQLPSENLIAEARVLVDPIAVRTARETLLAALGRALADDLWATYHACAPSGPYTPDFAAAGRRALRNLCLSYLVAAGDPDALEAVRQQFLSGDNMTDRQAALAVVLSTSAPFKPQLIVQAAREWHGQPLLMNKWFKLQACAVARPGEPAVLDRVRRLQQHAAYLPRNPNSIYALVLAFCSTNLAEFHRADGAGYAFWIDQVLSLDRINPIVAARVARVLERWRKYTPDRQRLMRDELERVIKEPSLSRDVREIVHKALDA